MSKSLTIIALTLTGLATFKRRDLNLNTGVPVVIKQGETIGVTEAMAESLLDEDNVRRNSDHEEIPYFTVAAEGAPLTYDFVTPLPVPEPVEPGVRTTAHDDSALPKVQVLTNEHVKAQARPARGQRVKP